MALLTGPWARALDADLNIVSTAKLRIYNVGTVTLASNVHLDAAMSGGSPAANPLSVSGSDGWFPQIYAPSGSQYDMRLETSTGSLIKAFPNQEAVGAGTDSLERDFGTSRGRMVGMAGVTSFEAGNPVGDDVGGDVRLGGWENTQADTAEIDAVVTHITGNLDVDGKRLVGLVSSAATPFSGVSSVDIALPDDPAGVTAYEVMIWGLTHSAATTLVGRFSFNGGAAYVATGYDGLATNFAGGVATVGADGPDTVFPIANGLAGAANKPTTVRLLIFTVNSGSAWTTTQAYSTGYIPGTAEHGITLACGFSPTGNGRATHLRVLPGSGTITGFYRVTPLRGSGDT